MAIGVDVTVRKARKTKNTPLYKIRNRFGFAALAFGTAFGLFLHFAPFLESNRQNTFGLVKVDPEEEQARRRAVGFIIGESSDILREAMKSMDRIDTPSS